MLKNAPLNLQIVAYSILPVIFLLFSLFSSGIVLAYLNGKRSVGVTRGCEVVRTNESRNFFSAASFIAVQKGTRDARMNNELFLNQEIFSNYGQC